MDDFNRTDYDRFFDSNLECVIEWVIVDDTTDVSPEDTALLGPGSDPSYRWWRPDAPASLCQLDRPQGMRYSEEDTRILNAYDKNIRSAGSSGRPMAIVSGMPNARVQSLHTPSVPHILSEQSAQVGDHQIAGTLHIVAQHEYFRP